MVIFKPELVDRVWRKANVGREGRKEKVKKDETPIIGSRDSNIILYKVL